MGRKRVVPVSPCTGFRERIRSGIEVKGEGEWEGGRKSGTLVGVYVGAGSDSWEQRTDLYSYWLSRALFSAMLHTKNVRDQQVYLFTW